MPDVDRRQPHLSAASRPRTRSLDRPVNGSIPRHMKVFNKRQNAYRPSIDNVSRRLAMSEVYRPKLLLWSWAVVRLSGPNAKRFASIDVATWQLAV